MLQPNGPLPAAVYWRRRAVALAGFVLVLLAVIWLVAAVVGDEPDGEARPAAVHDPNAEPPPGSGEAGPPVTRSGGAPGTSPASPSPGPGPSPSPPQPCPDELTAIEAQPEQPAYPAGARPVFRLLVTNTGPVPCTRDLDSDLQEVLVFAADGTRLWSSNDCYSGDGAADSRTLRPGEAAVSTVAWAGRSSRPNCAGQRVALPAGDYLVVANLGPLTSPPTPFRLTP